MAIAFDAQAQPTSTSASSISWSHTVISATKGVVIVGALAHNDASGAGWSTTLSTFNGTAMTRQSQTIVVAGARDQTTALYSLATAGEGTGAKTVSISYETTANLNGLSHTYTGVDQTTPVDGIQSDGGNNGTTPSVTVTTGSAGDLVVGFGNMEDVLTGVGSGQTVRVTSAWSNDFTFNSSEEAGGTSVVHSYTRTGTATKSWSIHAINLNQDGGASDPQPDIADAINLTEDVVIEAILIPGLDKSDTVTIKESVTVSLETIVEINISVVDTIEVSELPSISPMQLSVNLNDTLDIVDIPSFEGLNSDLDISIIDAVNLTDSVTLSTIDNPFELIFLVNTGKFGKLLSGKNYLRL